MSFWSDITSAIGSVFGAGDNSTPSSDNNNQKKKQNTPVTNNNLNPGARVNLPSIFKPPTNLGAGQNNAPIFTQPANNNHVNLTAQPIAPPKPVAPAPVPQHPFASQLIHLNPTPYANINAANTRVQAADQAPQSTPDKVINTGADIAANVASGIGQGFASLVGSPLSLASMFLRHAGHTDAANSVDSINAPAKISHAIAGGRAEVDTAAQQDAYNKAYKVGSVAGSVATLVPGGAALATHLPVVGEDVARVLSRIPGVSLEKAASETAGASDVADETAPRTPENTPLESGIKTPEEPAPTNGPGGETTKTPATPGAPESGIKPVATPAPTTPPVEPTVPTPTEVPLQPTAAPAEVANAEKAAQAAVDKTAETPQPAPAPETAVPNVTPTQAASEQVAASPEQQVVNEAPNVPDYKTPHKNGKASVPGNSEARYNTGDSNLDAIINDAIIAHKGTAATAGDRADALDQVGITSKQRAQIRNIATHNVDKNTGKISANGIKQIEDVIKGPKATPVTTPAPVVSAETTPVASTETPTEIPAVAPKQTYNTSLEKTGNLQTDLENAAQAVHDRVENPADFTGNKDAQSIIDQVNGRQQGNQVVAKELADRLDSVLTKEQQANVQNALQSGTVDKLTGTEKEVAQILQQHLNNPADVLRSATDKDYVSGNNYSTQIRKGGSIVNAAKTANNTGKTLKSKVSSFNDLLQQSRFSQARTLGKFTSGSKILYGDPGELGLVAKKDGTFVDKSGKVYNYSHATNQELSANSNVKFQGLSNSTHTYATDTMNLKARTDAANELIKNPEKYGLSEKPIEDNQPSVTIKGSDGENHEFFTDKGTQKALQQSGVTTGGIGNKTSLPVSLFNKATTGVVQSIVMNPTVHSMNQLVQGVVASGLEKNGVGGFSFLKNAFNHNVDDVVAFHDAGGYVPTYGKNIQGVLSKLTFGGSKLNEKAMSAIDGNFRVSAFKSLTDGGMDAKQAAATVNRFMGDRSVFKDAEPHMGMFMHYFVTMNKSAGSTIVQAFKGHPGALANAAMAAGATYGLQKVWQDFTGNQGASVHAPGMVGIAKDYVKSAEDLAQTHFKNAVSPLTNRVNPLVTQGAEQLLGVNEYGDKFKNGASRAENLGNVSPLINDVIPNGHAIGEKAANTFGLYTPHIKGDMATNNPKLAPVLNVKGAQNGSTVAFPKDFTGEQNSKAVNNYLSSTNTPYSSKTAATIANQTQSQQQAYTANTKALKAVGITSASDINAYGKLSSGDQKNYLTATQQVIKNGDSVSNATLRAQLVKNGQVETAANLDTSIPSKLSQQDKTALETYSTAGNSGQKNVWLQDNNNANNYYSAVINQKQAQGALTTDDTDTGATYTGSGNSLYVKALVAKTNQQNNVPQSLVELYKDTTKTEYDNMSGAQKDALTNYAAQLNKNGVIDKFGIGNGTSAKSSASARDRAAGLPSGDAVVKPGTSTGIKPGTVKYAAPTLAVAKASTAKSSNPFVRSISATSGVK